MEDVRCATTVHANVKGNSGNAVHVRADTRLLFARYSVPAFDVDAIIDRTLLALVPQSKYTMEYRKMCGENIAALVGRYTEFVRSVAAIVVRLYKKIGDQTKLVVTDSDFSEIKRRNPNVTALVKLEGRKEEERHRRTAVMTRELDALVRLVRMLDYTFLEAQRTRCYEKWQAAFDDLSSDGSTVFTIEVSFTEDGSVGFVPSMDTLVATLESERCA